MIENCTYCFWWFLASWYTILSLSSILVDTTLALALLALWPLAAPLAGASLRIEVRRRGSSAASAVGGADVRLGSA